MKRVLGFLLNLILLLSIIPTLIFGLLLWIGTGEPDFSLEYGLNVLYLTLSAFVVWHLFVWEHRIEIHRRWVLFVVRCVKAVWICSAVFLVSGFSPHEMIGRSLLVAAIPFLLGGAAYAGIRHLFAPPFRI